MKSFFPLSLTLALALAQPAVRGATADADLAALRAKAERGNAIAQYNLGLAHAEGRGTPVDRIEAVVWLTLAAEGGSRGQTLETLLDNMSAAELEEARRRIEARRAAHAQARVPVIGSKAAAPPPVIRAPAEPATSSPGDSATLAAALRETQAKLAAHERELTRLRDTLATTDATARASASESAQLRTHVQSLTAERDALLAEKTRLSSELVAKANAATTRAAETENATRAVTEAAARIERLSTALARATTERDTLAQAEASRTAHAEAHARELAALNERLATHARDLAGAQSIIAAHAGELARLRDAAEAAAQALAKTETEKRQLETQLAAALGEKTELANARSSTSDEAQRLRTALAASEQARTDLERKAQTAAADFAATAARTATALEQAGQRAARLAADNEALSRQLAQAENVTRATVDTEGRLATATRSLATLEKERDDLRARVNEMSAMLAAHADAKARTETEVKMPPVNLAGSTANPAELDELRARTATAERDAEQARSELARTHEALHAARAVRAEPTRPAPASAHPTRPVIASGPAGNASPPTAPPSTAGPRVHTIAAGETLAAISRQYYGTPNRWQEILAANRDTLRDERSLVAGRTLRIP